MHYFESVLNPFLEENRIVGKKLNVANVLLDVKRKHPRLTVPVDEVINRINNNGI